MRPDSPRDLRYSSEDGEKYRRLTQDELSPFNGCPFKDVFLYAASLGYREGYESELEKPLPNIPLSAFREDDLWILRAIAIARKKSLDVLGDEREIYRLAEHHANGAIEYVYRDVFGGVPGEPIRRMMSSTLEEYERPATLAD